MIYFVFFINLVWKIVGTICHWCDSIREVLTFSFYDVWTVYFYMTPYWLGYFKKKLFSLLLFFMFLWHIIVLILRFFRSYYSAYLNYYFIALKIIGPGYNKFSMLMFYYTCLLDVSSFIICQKPKWLVKE